MYDEFLKSLGFKYTYDQLKPEERAKVHEWYDALKKSELTLEKVAEFVTQIRQTLEDELLKPNLDARTDLFLKARLKNMLLLEALLSTPEKARKAILREAGR